jgi:hypothetical protein
MSCIIIQSHPVIYHFVPKYQEDIIVLPKAIDIFGHYGQFLILPLFWEPKKLVCLSLALHCFFTPFFIPIFSLLDEHHLSL